VLQHAFFVAKTAVELL